MSEIVQEPKEVQNRFYGKYQGIVVNNKDTDKLGRLEVKVPDVLGENKSGWARPCTPYAGKNVGLFLIPPIGTLVWVEFQQGDPDYPIWTGCFWAKKEEVPALESSERGNPDIKILKTEFCTINLDDSKTKGITIDTKIGKQELKIVMDGQGIKITASNEIEINASRQMGTGKIVLNSSKVSINNDALEVT